MSIIQHLEDAALEIHNAADLDSIDLENTLPINYIGMFYGSKGDGAPMKLIMDKVSDIAEEKGLSLNYRTLTPGDENLTQIYGGRFAENWSKMGFEIKDLTDKLDGEGTQLEVFANVYDVMRMHAPIIRTSFLEALKSNPADTVVLNSGIYAMVHDLVAEKEVIIIDPYFLNDRRVIESKTILSNLAPGISLPMGLFEGQVTSTLNNAIDLVFGRLFANSFKNEWDGEHTRPRELLNLLRTEKRPKTYNPEKAFAIHFALTPDAEPIFLDEEGRATGVDNSKCMILPRVLPSTVEAKLQTDSAIQFIKSSRTQTLVYIGGATDASEDSQKVAMESLMQAAAQKNISILVIDDGKLDPNYVKLLPKNIHVTKNLLNLELLLSETGRDRICGVIQHGGSGTSAILDMSAHAFGVAHGVAFSVDEQERNGIASHAAGRAVRPINRRELFSHTGRLEKYIDSIINLTQRLKQANLLRDEFDYDRFRETQGELIYAVAESVVRQLIRSRKK